MRFPLVRSGDDKSAISWWEWLFAPLLAPVFLISFLVMLPLFILAGLTVVALPFLIFAARRRERRFAQEMRERDRFIPWHDLKGHLESGRGTLVVEQAQKDGVCVWWTLDNVEEQAPAHPPSEKELDYFRWQEPHPFVAWCHERYLHPHTGKASLTKPPYSYPPGFVTAEFFRSKFPNQQVVSTVKLA